MTLAIDPTTLPPAIKGWLGAHVAFRRDADALRAAVIALDPSDTVAATRLAAAFAITTQMLHEHHDTEDELIFPELITRSPAFAGVVMTMSLEHVDLDDVVDDITRALATLTGKTSRANEVHQRLARQVETFRSLVNLHLEVEEDHALPMFLRYFTTDEIDAIGDEHFAKNADVLPVMIPWSASAMAPDEVVEMLANLPAAVQENYSRWSLAFQQAFAAMLAQPAQAVAA
jgi:predicted outer membrane lipoprotein